MEQEPISTIYIDLINKIDVLTVCVRLLPRGDIEILAAGTPPTKKQFCFMSKIQSNSSQLLEIALFMLSLFLVLNC